VGTLDFFPPNALMSPYPKSSAKIKTIFGFSDEENRLKVENRMNPKNLNFISFQ
jgi:hypothetical protein